MKPRGLARFPTLAAEATPLCLGTVAELQPRAAAGHADLVASLPADLEGGRGMAAAALLGNISDKGGLAIKVLDLCFSQICRSDRSSHIKQLPGQSAKFLKGAEFGRCCTKSPSPSGLSMQYFGSKFSSLRCISLYRIGHNSSAEQSR